MNEYQRMQYLDAMGIDTFVPRFLLPSAKASLQCRVSTQDAANTTSADFSSSAVTDSTCYPPQTNELGSDELRSLSDGLNSVLSALDLDASSPVKRSANNTSLNAQPKAEAESLVEKGEPAGTDLSTTGPESAQAQTDNSSANEGAHAEAARFNLGLWFTDTQFQVVDSREAQDALPTDTLLTNILVSTGLLNAKLPPMEIQKWPIPGVNLSDQSWYAASSMLQDFLSVRFEKLAVKGFILFGEDAFYTVCGKSNDSSETSYKNSLYNIVNVPSFNTTALVLPALREHLYQPQLKQSLWAACQKFVQRSSLSD